MEKGTNYFRPQAKKTGRYVICKATAAPQNHHLTKPHHHNPHSEFSSRFTVGIIDCQREAQKQMEVIDLRFFVEAIKQLYCFYKRKNVSKIKIYIIVIKYKLDPTKALQMFCRASEKGTSTATYFTKET